MLRKNNRTILIILILVVIVAYYGCIAKHEFIFVLEPSFQCETVDSLKVKIVGNDRVVFDGYLGCDEFYLVLPPISYDSELMEIKVFLKGDTIGFESHDIYLRNTIFIKLIVGTEADKIQMFSKGTFPVYQ